MTRLTKDRGAIVHDDRLEALSMAVNYWTEQMDTDAETMAVQQMPASALATFCDDALLLFLFEPPQLSPRLVNSA